MKNLLLVCSIIFILMFCSDNSTTSKKEAGNNKETGAGANTIKDEKLYSFMLGGVYFFHGYGGGNETLNQLIKEQMQTKPGDEGFIEEVHNVYTSYFKYPFKPEDGGAKETLAEY